MSEDRVEIVRATWRALADGGVEAMLEHVADDFEMTTPPEISAEPDTYRGHAGIRRYFDSFYDAVDEIRVEAGRAEEVDGRVVMALTLTSRGRTTGLEASIQTTAVCDVAADKVRRLTFFQAWGDAVEAARA